MRSYRRRSGFGCVQAHDSDYVSVYVHVHVHVYLGQVDVLLGKFVGILQELGRGPTLREPTFAGRRDAASHSAYAIVDSRAAADWRESRRVCCTMIGTSDSKTLE